MWKLGSGSRYLIEVRSHWEIESGARDLSIYRGKPWLKTQQQDWDASEGMARDYLKGSLFFRLGVSRGASEVLAAKLVRFSVRAHAVWWNEGGMHQPRAVEVNRPTDFLAGMGAELIGGCDGGWGSELMRDVLNWPCGPNETSDLAYMIWAAQRWPNGRDKQNWRLAEWLWQLRKRAVGVATEKSVNNPVMTYDHLLEALAAQIFVDPCETARVFEAAA